MEYKLFARRFVVVTRARQIGNKLYFIACCMADRVYQLKIADNYSPNQLLT
jgi:hypothetical protein